MRRTLKTAVISASSSGSTEVVAAVTGKRIQVVQAFISVNAAVNVKFQSATTDITGLFYGAAAGNGIVITNNNDSPWFGTAPGEALNINLSSAVAVGGVLVYYTE